MSKKKIYFFSFLILSLAAFFLLVKNIKKPNFYVAGHIEASSLAASELSSFSYVFFSVYDEANSSSMPYGASRQSIQHDFSRGDFHFVLNPSNFFVMPSSNKDFPKNFTLKVKFSHSETVGEASSFFKEIKGLFKGKTGVVVRF